MSTSEQPWRVLPRGVVGVVAPELPVLRDEVVEAIAREVPEYARPLEGAFGRDIRLGTEAALRHFVALVEQPDGAPREREVYRALGRAELRAGRSLDALQAAYRIGARVAWRRVARAGLDAGLEPAVLCALADAIFAYIDELAADSVEGYAQAQSTAASERERRRRRLLSVLLGPHDEARLVAAATAAGWTVPRALRVLACRPEDVDPIARRLPAEVLAGTAGAFGVVVADAAVDVRAACAGRHAALGPVRPPAAAGASLARARTVLAAVGAGTLPAGTLDTDDLLTALALHEARGTLRDLAARRLAPLEELTPRARERLVATLRAYLDHRGNAPAMAAAMAVHPQTARYRLRRLRELLGDALEDPEARFELALAVRSTRP